MEDTGSFKNSWWVGGGREVTPAWPVCILDGDWVNNRADNLNCVGVGGWISPSSFRARWGQSQRLWSDLGISEWMKRLHERRDRDTERAEGKMEPQR